MSYKKRFSKKLDIIFINNYFLSEKIIKYFSAIYDLSLNFELFQHKCQRKKSVEKSIKIP